MTRAAAAVLLAGLLSVGLLAPAGAQETDATPDLVQGLMAAAVDDLAAASRLLAGDPDDAARAAAEDRLEDACVKYADVLDVLPRVDVSPAAKAEVERIAHYNTACARSLQGRTDAALDAFARALEAGYADFVRVERDPDLDPLREEPRYAQLLERARARAAAEAREAAADVVSDEALFPFDFEVTTLAGETLSLEDLRGKVVIVDFWGTWCGPCKAEIPSFVALKEQLGDRLAVVGLAWEKGATGERVEARVRATARELEVDYPLAMATPPIMQQVPDLDAFPTTLFIDKRGRVRAKEVGYRDLGVLRSLVLTLDAEPAPEEDEARERAF